MSTHSNHSRGVMIFAYANELIDYVDMASWSARNIHRHLGVPVCVITDTVDLPTNHSFDQVILTQKHSRHTRQFSDLSGPVTWYNHSRADAYELSPWHTTLVLDADYVVASDQLQVLFDSDQDFLAHDHAHDVTGAAPFDSNNYFGRYSVPMSWATVMYFRRSTGARLIFDAMRMVRDNWTHYCDLYQIQPAMYRNDHALTIAQLIVNGNCLEWPAIPWSLASVTPSPRVTQLSADQYRVDYHNAAGQSRWITVSHDLHVMGKGHLGGIVANPC